MKIAGESMMNRFVRMIRALDHLFASPYNPKQKYFQFGDMKERTREEMPRINLTQLNIGCDAKKINGTWVFPSFRKLNEEAEKEINKIDEEIKQLTLKKDKYLQDHFMEWNLLTLDEATEENIKNNTYFKQHPEKIQEFRNRVKLVLEQLAMSKTELRKRFGGEKK